MIRLIITLLLSLTSVTSVIARNLAQRCEGMTGVTTIDINKSMLKMSDISYNISSALNLNIAERVDNITIINTNTTDASNLTKTVIQDYMSDGVKFERMTNITEQNNSAISLYTRSITSDNNEYLIVIENSSALTVINITGPLTLEELGQIGNN